MTKINGIPTADEFRKSVGRYGLRRKLKRVDVQMNSLISALSSVQVYRSSKSMRAIEEMRKLRKRCITWLDFNRGKKRFETTTITTLGHASDGRLQFLRNLLLAPTPAARRARGRNAELASRHDKGLTMNGTFGKKLDRNYDIERFSSNHLPGPAVNGNAKLYFQRFKNSIKGGTQFQLEDFVQHCMIPDSQDDPGSVLLFGRTTRVVDLLQKGVKYCTAAERLNYQLDFIGAGIVLDSSGVYFDTSGMHTNSAGAGWGIFVVNFDQTFYAGPHSVNEFHHSSFLAGDPVFSAGEISAADGKVVGLTNKTGHYKAGPDELMRSLGLLRNHGVNIDEVAVSDPFRGKGLWRRGTDVLASNGDFSNPILRNLPQMNRPNAG